MSNVDFRCKLLVFKLNINDLYNGFIQELVIDDDENIDI